MAFWDLFDRKAGGTVVGNILRGVANTVTGGALGNGDLRLNQMQIDAKNLSDTEFYYKYGFLKQGVDVPSFGDALENIFERNPDLQQGSGGTFLDRLISPFTGTINRTSETVGKSAAKGALSSYWWVIILPFGFIIFLMIYLHKKSKRR